MCSYKYENAVKKVSEIKYNIIYVSYRIYKLMDLYISHDKSKRLNIYLFGLFFYTSIRIKERVVNLMIKFGKGVVKYRVLILIVAFALLIPSGISFINTRINFDILSYLPSQIETMKGQDIMVDEFGTGAQLSYPTSRLLSFSPLGSFAKT